MAINRCSILTHTHTHTHNTHTYQSIVAQTLTHHAPIFLSYHASRKIYLRKLEVGEQEKRARSWCHNYLFSRSLLLVSNGINHRENFKGKSRLACYEIVNHASSSYTQSRLTRLGPIAHHAENLGPITNHGKPLNPIDIW